MMNWNSMPIQNTARAIPLIVTARNTWSNIVFLLIAEITPMGIPSAIVKNIENATISSVAGKRPINSLEISRWV